MIKNAKIRNKISARLLENIIFPRPLKHVNYCWTGKKTINIFVKKRKERGRKMNDLRNKKQKNFGKSFDVRNLPQNMIHVYQKRNVQGRQPLKF